MSLRNQCQAWVKLGCHKAPMALRAATGLILLTAWWDPHPSSTSAARKRWRRCEKEQSFYLVLIVWNRHLKGARRVLWLFWHRASLSVWETCIKLLWEVWCVAPLFAGSVLHPDSWDWKITFYIWWWHGLLWQINEECDGEEWLWGDFLSYRTIE